MITKNLYKGLSFVNYKNNKTLSLSDVDLVKQDLLNHIFTSFNERIMMPAFGTSIPDAPFEQMDDVLFSVLAEDIYNVIDYDPRVALTLNNEGLPQNFNIEPIYEDHTIVISVDIDYIELDFTETLSINLDYGE